jgi:hypothetical protein
MSLLRRHKDSDSGSGQPTSGDLGHSQFGTPLNEILFARVDYDPLEWLPIPIAWEDEDDPRWSSPKGWAESNGPELWALWQELNPGAPEPDTTAVARTIVELRSYAEQFGGFRPKDPFEIGTYLHVPSPTVLALPVRVFVDDHPDRTAEQAAGVDGPGAIEPPVVEKFTFDALGEGLKVTAHRTLTPEPGDDTDANTLWVQVRYAIKIPDKQAVVTVTTSDTDLGRVAGATEDLDQFVRTITVKHCN